LFSKLQERIGMLSGTSAVVRVGASTPGEQAELRLRLEAAIKGARLAMDRGVVAGGGAALLACSRGLGELDLAGEAAAGVRILAEALAEPMRAIVANAGLEADRLLHEAHRYDPGWSFDVLKRDWVDASRGGPMDPLEVTLTALDAAVSRAVLALTADALVHRTSNA
jgi:chaperonin GroEL